MQYLQDLQEREAKALAKLPKIMSSVDSKITKAPPAKKESSISRTKVGHGNNGKNINYELGLHTIRVQKSGTTIAIDQIWNMNTAISFSSSNQHSTNEAGRRGSIDQFNQKSMTNEVPMLYTFKILNSSR